MAEFSKLIITGAGQALIAKVIAGTGNIRFTKVSTSDTAYEENKLEELTELSGIKQTSLISDIVRTNEVAVKIETAFHNTELTEGYYMRTMGLYAVDPDEGEILYAVTVETSGNCYIPPYNGVTVSGAYVQLITTVGNAEQVSLEVDAAAVATIGDLRELEEKVENLKMDLGDAYVQFVEYETRENIQAQDTLGTMFGKIKKWFTDLKAGAFSGVANNCTTTEEGSVLDARQGKMLLEEIEEINSNIGGNIITYKESEDAYYIQHGADAVPKKLGSPTPEDVKILKHWYGSGENQSYTFSEDYSLVISFGGVQRHSTSENNVSITDTISSSTAQRIVLENQRSNKKSGLSNSTGTYIISLHTLTVLYTNVSAGDTISHNIGTTNNTTNSGCIIGFK